MSEAESAGSPSAESAAQNGSQNAIKATDFLDLDNIPEVKPEGMSKSQWKKLQRKKKFQEHKKEYIQIRKEKKKEKNAARRAEIAVYKENNEEVPEHLIKRPRKPKAQSPTGSKIILDCSFDDMMNDKEKVSLSSQITRAYSANRFSPNFVDLEVTSFGGSLKRRFDVDLKSSAYQNWKNIKFNEEPFEPTENTVYLSADAEEALEVLEPDMTYVIGGIVDKGRYKYLCKNKAEKLGMKCYRLPIDEYIHLFGRQVLTTTHVVEIMLEWWNTKDWKAAFEKILPQRKLIIDENGQEVSVEPEEGTPVVELEGKSEEKPVEKVENEIEQEKSEQTEKTEESKPQAEKAEEAS